MDAVRAGGDGGEYHLRCGDGKVVAVMLADTDEVDADLIGQHRLVDEIPNDFGGVQRRAIRSAGDVAESVETEFDNGLLLGFAPAGTGPAFYRL